MPQPQPVQRGKFIFESSLLFALKKIQHHKEQNVFFLSDLIWLIWSKSDYEFQKYEKAELC